MTDSTGYSVNYSWSTQPVSTPAPEQKPPLWALADCSVFSLPQQQVLLKLKNSDKKLVISEEIYQLLLLCAEFKPLAEHADYIVASLPHLAGKRAETIQLLEQIIQQGFMCSAAATLKNITNQSVENADTSLFGVIIRTCDRPQQLKRLLDSISKLQPAFAEPYNFWVADDSRLDSHRIQNRQLIQAFKSAHDGLTIQYYGPQQQQKLSDQLKQIFPEYLAQIEWLLQRDTDKSVFFTGGRVFNHLLLLSAGQRFLLMDDDIVCEPYQAPEPGEGLSISMRQLEVGFYDSREALCEQLQRQDIDPFAAHNEALGASIASAVSGFEQKPEILQGLSGVQAAPLSASTRVMRTVSGIVGDPGTVSLAWMYELEGVTRERLLSDPVRFQQFRSNRCLWLGSATRTLSVDPALMMTSLSGFDNSRLLPPVSPLFRNEDYFFGHVLKYLYQDHVTLDFPWGLLHFPEPERHWSEDQLDKPKNAGVSAFLADVARYQSNHCLAKDVEQRLVFLAEMYLSLADAEPTQLAEGIEENLLHTRVAALNQLQKILADYEQSPSYWAQDINRLLKANGESLVHSEPLVADPHAGDDRKQQVETVREVLAQMGQAMKVWPQLWQYCMDHSDSLFDYE